MPYVCDMEQKAQGVGRSSWLARLYVFMMHILHARTYHHDCMRACREPDWNLRGCIGCLKPVPISSIGEYAVGAIFDCVTYRVIVVKLHSCTYD
jgi:hypothetical protein